MSAVLTLFLIVLLVFFLIIGLPIAVSLGLCAVFGAVFSNIPLSNLVKPMANSLISSPMISIPFFLLVGNIMFESGISKRLIEFLNSFLGSLRGGLNYAAVFACALFSALAGPAPITVIAVGSILYAEMSALGYSQARSAGLFTAAGSLGSIIPPSVIMVVYASITKAPLKDLFVSGAGIGVMIAIVFLIICFYLGRSEFAPKRVLPFSFATFAKTFFAALPAVFIPIIIVGGIYFKLLSALQSG
ncbi:MAG: TRAP transporter large permease subunit, partial [Elusimicrobiota bacterium]|nr:TRAP transporter large permease subunit [Elusimicrobiota bacterium]